jgi:hypothetical protein
MKNISKEIEMYQPVETFLKMTCDCVKVWVDRREDRKKVHLRRNLRIRDPDVVGVTEKKEVYIAEGKCFRSGTSFEECVNQAESLKQYAEYLYVFFPRKEWDLRQEDDQRNRKVLRDKGIGLLLVDELGKCEERLPSRRNEDTEEAMKDKFLTSMGMHKEEAVVPKLSYLSSTEASTAVEIVQRFDGLGKKIAGEAIFNALKVKVKKWEPSISDDTSVSRFFFFYPVLWDLSISVDLDVFGAYLGDGHSCIWVTREVARGTVLQHLKEPFKFGTHLCFHEKVTSLRDIASELIRKSGEEKFWLMHRVEFFGRSCDGLRKELEDLLKKAKSLK